MGMIRDKTVKFCIRHPDLDSTVMGLTDLKGEPEFIDLEIAQKDGIRTIVKVRKGKNTQYLEFGALIGRKGDFLIVVPDEMRPNMKHQLPIVEERFP